MASNKVIVTLLIVLIAITIVETVLIVRSVDFSKSKPDLNIYMPEQPTTQGQVQLTVINAGQESG